MISKHGSLRLCRLFGIEVFLHWSWFIVALIEIEDRKSSYSSVLWNGAEYIALFAIVLMHEFGHALACRQVGGKADRIILWPLGGVAFVSPPQRPGATLWAIAAGPLVNVALTPILLPLALWNGWATGDLKHFFTAMLYINSGLLIFNLLPVYPLDGGQILRCLLWYPLGKTRSLKIATGVGFLGAAVLITAAVANKSIWTGILALFLARGCWNSWKLAKVMEALEALPRNENFKCPSCSMSPPRGDLWECDICHTRFNTFETEAGCPQCQRQFETTSCLHCGESNPMHSWIKTDQGSAG